MGANSLRNFAYSSTPHSSTHLPVPQQCPVAVDLHRQKVRLALVGGVQTSLRAAGREKRPVFSHRHAVQEIGRDCSGLPRAISELQVRQRELRAATKQGEQRRPLLTDKKRRYI